MNPEHVLAILVFSVVAAGTPGPSNALLAATGARVGLLRGLPALLGVAAGMALMLFVVAYGLAAVLLENATLLLALKWIGAAVLGWFAWKIATARTAGGAHTARPVGFFGAAAFQWINPKSWLISASAAATFLKADAQPNYWQAGTLALLFVLAALPSCLPWLAFGAVMQRALRSERSLRAFNLVMGLLLAASVVLLVS
jgi:threonine/homoserine/homoserine lactone efflux protein